jgi:uncharacterized protein YndB with AHSA1/START domain
MKLGHVVFGSLGAAAGYALAVRPRHLRWGATDAEVRRAMPLDEDVPHPTYVTNRAVTIAAPPEQVWPWLAQMGEWPRGGYYSYVWIERLMGMQVANADAVLPALQRVEEGDVLDRMGYMTVKAVEPGRYLVLGPPDAAADVDSTWALALYPRVDGTTRLVSRVRARLPRGPRGLLWWALLDPGQFVMERKMLLGIKRRAEALAAAGATAGLAALGPRQPNLARTAG